jgi:hypothetical protein
MEKQQTKKREKNDDLSKNHSQRIAYRKRVQDDKERDEELKEYLKDTDGANPRVG